jgi:hypothetical protein
VPNTISHHDLEDARLPDSTTSLKFARAGWIRPSPSCNACQSNVDDVFGCVLYAQIIEGRAMKFGTTSRFRERMREYAGTATKILQFQDGLISSAPWLENLAYGKGDKFKLLAPGLFRAGKRVEVWATTLSSPKACHNVTGRKNSRCSMCKAAERSLNDRYHTIQYGWADRPS